MAPVAANRTSVSRRIAADPTSTALLLAGSTAIELWPGLRRVAEVSGRVVVETDIRDLARAASVRALPPQRTPTPRWRPRSAGSGRHRVRAFAPTGTGGVSFGRRPTRCAALPLGPAPSARPFDLHQSPNIHR